jgi:putative ABC transport system permease protein
MKLALWGLLVGIGVAIGAGRSMQSLLCGISAMDPITIIATSITLLVCALLAGYLPAPRASRVDPLVALRTD